MKTGFKKWDGMHDGKESGKNKWVVKIKLKKKTDTHVKIAWVDNKKKKKKLTGMAFHFLSFFNYKYLIK